MKNALFVSSVLIFLSLIPIAVSAACGVEQLPQAKELSYYQNLSGVIDKGYHTGDDLYNHGVIDVNTLRQYYLARDAWKPIYINYQDRYKNFIAEINLAIASSGEVFRSHCSSAEISSITFLQAKSQLEQQTRVIQSVFNHFSDRQPVTNDTLSNQQYYLKLTKVDTAKVAFNPNPIIVAVIDDGIYINHEDLRSNIWINSREIIGNGKDDDGNGYTDDIYGYDFLGSTPEMTVRGNHGTHVAGIIGAISKNNLGIQGIVENIKLMPLIACGESSCPTEAVVRAIRYAVDNGAKIINLSLGSNRTTAYSTQYDEAVQYAFQNGVLVVAAAGNGDIEANVGQNLDVIPQSPVCNDNDQNMVLGVGAVTNDGYRTPWSNYGRCVDIYAPGKDILSSSVPNLDEGQWYSTEDGTSFSAPIVAGIAALIKQKYPSINPREITELLRKTAWNGIIDATSALDTPYEHYPTNPQTPVFPSTTGSSVSNNVSNSTTEQTSDSFIAEQMRNLRDPNPTLIGKLKGSILLQVQTLGAAWYVNPVTLKRYYLKDGQAAYQMLRAFGLGISETDYTKIITGNVTLKNRLKGRIILRTQSHGEAYYINPKDLRLTYLKDGQAAYDAMRGLGLGITDIDISTIPIERFVSPE